MNEYSDHVLRLAEAALDRITELRLRSLRPTRIRMNPADYEQLPDDARRLWGVPIQVDPNTRVLEMTARQFPTSLQSNHRRTGRRSNAPGRLDPTSTPLGARLRDLRVSAKLTQPEMSRHLGTGSGRVSDWELGMHVPTLPTLIRYAEIFDMSVSELLSGVL